MAPSRSSENAKLFESLQNAIEEDKLYWIRNDAKIRASVNAKSYEEFRDRVAAAHLQNLSKSDKQRKQRNWTTITDGE